MESRTSQREMGEEGGRRRIEREKENTSSLYKATVNMSSPTKRMVLASKGPPRICIGTSAVVKSGFGFIGFFVFYTSVGTELSCEA